MKNTSILFIAILSLFACNRSTTSFDASGSFEADEIIISSEAAGVVRQLNLEEGQTLKAGDIVGYIDSTQIHLRKKQLLAQMSAVLSKKPQISIQLAGLQSQLKNAEKEQVRIGKMVKAEAATTKQLDDLNANVELLKKQIEAQKSSLQIATDGIDKEILPMRIQVEQLDDQLQKCKIVNPINGTVLAKFVEQDEMTAPGKPVYKIANLEHITLRVYISGNQLAKVKLNQKVKVFTDSGDKEMKEGEGTITWINSKAEFTPKTIQTKNERANLVYALKVKMPNDGSYKIGMYGEVQF